VIGREDVADEVWGIAGNGRGSRTERRKISRLVQLGWLGPTFREHHGAEQRADVVGTARMELVHPNAVNTRLSWFLYDADTHDRPFEPVDVVYARLMPATIIGGTNYARDRTRVGSFEIQTSSTE